MDSREPTIDQHIVSAFFCHIKLCYEKCGITALNLFSKFFHFFVVVFVEKFGECSHSCAMIGTPPIYYWKKINILLNDTYWKIFV